MSPAGTVQQEHRNDEGTEHNREDDDCADELCQMAEQGDGTRPVAHWRARFAGRW